MSLSNQHVGFFSTVAVIFRKHDLFLDLLARFLSHQSIRFYTCVRDIF